MTVRSACLALAVAVLSLNAYADDWAKQFPVSAGAELQVTANDASIHLTATDKDQIDVQVHTAGVRIPNDLQVSGTQAGNIVRLNLHARSSFCVGICIKKIEVDIQVPRNSTVNVKTSDGAIEANDLSGDLSLRSGDGRIVAHGASGRLNAETSDGHIDVDGRFEHLRLHSGDGRITARVNYGSKMDADWSVSTKDGNIELELPSDLAADLDAHTSDGRLDVSLPVEVQGSISRETMRGKLNGGGRRLEISTNDGSIHLRAAHGSL